MREIQAQQITDVVEKLCIEANYYLPKDVQEGICACRKCEDWDIAKGVLDQIIENYEIAEKESVPICQDTGMACVFLEIGQDVHIVGGDLREAVDEGVRRGYTNGYLRKSVVADPVRRGNTGDNTPAMLYVGLLMLSSIKKVDFDGDAADVIGAFLAIVMMPLTYSIANGIMFGMLAWVILKLATGKAKEISGVMWVSVALFAVYITLKVMGLA